MIGRVNGLFEGKPVRGRVSLDKKFILNKNWQCYLLGSSLLNWGHPVEEVFALRCLEMFRTNTANILELTLVKRASLL